LIIAKILKVLVYKYRGGNFKRDLKAIEKNFYWAPKFDELNDPCETLINIDPFKRQSKSIAQFFGKEKSKQFLEVERAFHNLFEVRKKAIGVYSLSKTYKDELLWAHYSDSHKGFCIEYELEELTNTYKSFEVFSFPVIYTKKPPEYRIQDINKTKNNQVIKKIAGYKSKRWGYEQEYRIVTGFYGEHPYYPNCLKSIYFGLNMAESEKILMMEKLKGRNIQFYQIIQKPNSYYFDAIKINDLTREYHTYLREIPSEITKEKSVRFRVLRKEYYRAIKAVIEIELASKVDRNSLEWVAHLLRNDLFRNVKRVFILYFLENDSDREFAWATSNFENSDLKVNINDFAK